MKQSVTAVLFDLDDTLIPQDRIDGETMWSLCRRVSKRFGVDVRGLREAVCTHQHRLWREHSLAAYCAAVGISSTEGLWASFEGEDERLIRLKHWSKTYRQRVWELALNDLGIPDVSLAEELAGEFVKERRARQSAFADAVPVLREIRQVYRVGLLTNGAPDLQRQKVALAGIGSYFDAVVVSGDIGIGKPDGSVFTHILGLLGVQAGNAVMVGNSLTSDISGAKRAGLTAVWLNRAEVSNDSTVVPDYEIHSLKEMMALACLQQ